MDDSESKVANALEMVARGRQSVTRQRGRIERLKAVGVPTDAGEQTLMVFLGTLAALEEYKQKVLREVSIPRKFRPL